ncbi:hypothetical protein BT63DRAFT_170068 [Microthyrium microscopicum]|uniref:CASTOR ACT domain-containing protein n=1 Tax=Microthyrium microscopicum TaxID=703497 RepID=A0A6A6US59_9PEZI|nr:hypothetical protein BT63DRAFT_170068 [Microthyrium microscopicum]
MEDSTSILNAQIQFIDVQLSLVHIPIELYSQCIHPILRLLLPESGNAQDLPFLNISINPVEASVVLPKELANSLFRPLLSSLNTEGKDASVTIAPDDYILMFVSGSGSSPSQRVIDLTTPLALAGISIFFITTYFSDYIICPRRSQAAVIAALKSQGFELSEHDWGRINQHSSQAYVNRPNTASSDSSGSQFLAPGTPPPSTLSELQVRTFNTLHKRNVVPSVNKETRLVQCAGKDDKRQEHALLLAIIKTLLCTPNFFSLTLSEGESPSLLLETRSLPLFELPSSANTNGRTSPGRAQYDQSLLMGTTSDTLIPIILDLRTLPLESTGIVCGIAGRLVDATKTDITGPVEMAYLSTTKAGAVMVMEDDLERAVQVLEMGAGPQ